MKREFLEALDVNGTKLPKEIVDQIMAENGKDVQAEQSKAAAKDGELSKANETIKSLQETVKKYDGADPEQLKQSLADLQKKYDTDIAQAKLDSALELALVQSKAKNTKAVKALLDMGNIKIDGDKLLGLEDQLSKLKTDADYLFEVDQPPIITGAEPANKTKPVDKPVEQMTYSEMMAYMAANPDAKL